MPDRFHRRLSGHLRRHGIAYAALTVALSFSPVPTMAADLVTTDEIAAGAVTAPKLAVNSVNGTKVVDGSISTLDIKDGNVTYADLNENAKGAKVIRYALGSFDFSEDSSLVVQLPGSWNANVVAASSWSASMQQTAGLYYYTVPGHGVASVSDYRLFVHPNGELHIDAATGDGEPYVDINVYRTVATSTQTVP